MVIPKSRAFTSGTRDLAWSATELKLRAGFLKQLKNAAFRNDMRRIDRRDLEAAPPSARIDDDLLCL